MYKQARLYKIDIIRRSVKTVWEDLCKLDVGETEYGKQRGWWVLDFFSRFELYYLD